MFNYKKSKTKYFFYAQHNLGRTFSMVVIIENEMSIFNAIQAECEKHFGDKKFIIKMINKL